MGRRYVAINHLFRGLNDERGAREPVNSRLLFTYYLFEASRGVGAQACDGNYYRLWVRSLFEVIIYLRPAVVHKRVTVTTTGFDPIRGN